MPSNCGAGEDSWKSLSTEIKPVSLKENQLWILVGKDWCWSWNSSISVIWCEQWTHWKSPWSWEGLRAEGEESIRGWDGWMASSMQFTWNWANFGRWWGTGRPGVLKSMGSQRVRHKGQLNNNAVTWRSIHIVGSVVLFFYCQVWKYPTIYLFACLLMDDLFLGLRYPEVES